MTDTELDELYKLLNPPDFLGHVQGTSDERSLVYVTGQKGQPQALIFVGFDAGVRLKGLRRWGQVEKKMKGVGEGPHIDGRATGCSSNTFAFGKYVDPYEKERTVGMERKGKAREVMHVGTTVELPTANRRTPRSDSDNAQTSCFGKDADDTRNSFTRVGRHGNGKGWELVRKVPAMYLELSNLGYNFGKASEGRL